MSEEKTRLAVAVNEDALAEAERAEVLRLARVPEHSPDFMAAMSGGRPFTHQGYLFLAGASWLTGIGYPLALATRSAPARAVGQDLGAKTRPPRSAGAASSGLPAKGDLPGSLAETLNPDHFAKAVPSALSLAAERGWLREESPAGRGLVDVFAVAPSFPASLRAQVSERDVYYILPTGSGLPKPLRRFVRRAAEALRVEEGADFTPAHRRLWSEFLVRPGLGPKVRELYAKTEDLLRRRVPGVTLLDALDRDNRLAASLLLDFAPENFCSYIIGAHSRRHYTPHATDLLFAALLDKAAERGKKYIHLGLGVNAGITRFKTKWGGRPDLTFEMAAWREKLPAAARRRTAYALGPASEDLGRGTETRDGPGYAYTLLNDRLSLPGGESKQAIFNSLPAQKPFAMLWELEKEGRRSWIGGSAHFFECSFERSFEKLFGAVDNVVFEGPLDPESLAHFERSGRTRRPGDPCLYDLLAPEELQGLKRMVRGPEGGLYRLLNHEYRNKADVEDYLKNTRPWYAFFSLWTAFLERHGWRRSVDLDAWNQALRMGKSVIAMESREEQLASLESVPPERILVFFRRCHDWPRRMRQNLRTYLLGDLGGMAGTSTEFPTRIHSVIGLRDRRFCERMLPFVSQGRCIVFVGSAHMLNLRGLLAAEGFKVSKVSPGPLHKLKTRLYARLHPESDFE